MNCGEDESAEFYSVGSRPGNIRQLDGKDLVGYSAMKWVSGGDFGTRLKLD